MAELNCIAILFDVNRRVIRNAFIATVSPIIAGGFHISVQDTLSATRGNIEVKARTKNDVKIVPHLYLTQASTGNPMNTEVESHLSI